MQENSGFLKISIFNNNNFKNIACTGQTKHAPATTPPSIWPPACLEPLLQWQVENRTFGAVGPELELLSRWKGWSGWEMAVPPRADLQETSGEKGLIGKAALLSPVQVARLCPTPGPAASQTSLTRPETVVPGTIPLPGNRG